MKVRLFPSKKSILIALSLLIMPFFPYQFVSAISEGVHVVSKQGQQLFLYEDYHALVIGVSNYDSWPKLPYATKDAKQVAERLKKMGYQVKLVLDPNSRELKAILNEMVYTIGNKKNRAVLVYYAGHGETETLADNTKMGYLIPKDCPLLKQNPVGFSSHAISLRDIESISLRIRSKHVLMLFDSCFSGSLFSLVRAVPEDITEKSDLAVRQFITAGREDEKVPDRSIFKRSFLVGLEGDADLTGDGYITGSELGMYLADKVVNYTHGRQHPQYGKINNPNLDRGDFIFVRWEKRGNETPKEDSWKAKEKSVSTLAPEAEKTKADANYEIVFWESIRDSNDCKMYNAYLKEYSSGKFSQLAKIYMKKLVCKDAYRAKYDTNNRNVISPPKVKTTPGKAVSINQKTPHTIEATPAPRINIPQNQKTEIQTETASLPKKKLKDELKADSRLRLAVFPFYFSRKDERSPGLSAKGLMTESLSRTLSTNQSPVPVYSYYTLGPHVTAKRISQDIIDNKVLDDMWPKPGFFSSGRKPNIGVISSLGQQLEVDLVLTGSFLWDISGYGWDITYYVCNVHSKNTYSKTTSFSHHNLYSNMKSFTEKFFASFNKYMIRSNQQEALSEQSGGGQTLASLPPKKDLKSSSELSIAVFPWYFSAPMELHEKETIEALKEMFAVRFSSHTIYSYYDLGSSVDFQQISKNIISDGIIDEIWTSKSFFSVEPNMDYICNLGEKLSSDIVLLYRFSSNSKDAARVTIYLINAKLKTIHNESFGINNNSGLMRDQIKIDTEEFLENHFTLIANKN